MRTMMRLAQEPLRESGDSLPAARRWRLYAALRARAAELQELPYDKWREEDHEDTIRSYALRLHELSMLKTSPQKIIADGSDWHFLDELTRELKA